MKVLVAVAEPQERERVLAILDNHFASSGRLGDESLHAALDRVRPTIVIIDADEIASLITASPCAQSIALIGATPTGAEFSKAFAAGADDVLRAGACKEEIWGRVGNLVRMRARTTPMPTLRMRIGEVKVWKDIERIVASELGELLGTSLRLSEGNPRPLVQTSVIPLTLVSDHLLVQLGIGVDETTKEQLVEMLLGGDSSGDALRDALREMANTAGGAIRRAALDDGVSFSIGLPSNENLFASSKQRVWTISDGNGLQLDCTIALSANKPIRVSASDLREGMVVARDVVTSDGTIIVTAGTSLTSTTAAQISRIASDREIEIEASFDRAV